MISELRISHLGVIAEAEVELSTGFTVVTGETGAGKTMFVSALSLLMGRKVGSGVVRKGAEKAEVEGIFSSVTDSVRSRIEEAGGSAEDEAIISRTVAQKGRARATAGGRTVPISVLTEISDELITLHGQSEQLRLKGPAQQRQLLDATAAPNSKQWPRNTTQHLRTGARPRPRSPASRTAPLPGGRGSYGSTAASRPSTRCARFQAKTKP